MSLESVSQSDEQPVLRPEVADYLAAIAKEQYPSVVSRRFGRGPLARLALSGWTAGEVTLASQAVANRVAALTAPAETFITEDVPESLTAAPGPVEASTWSPTRSVDLLLAEQARLGMSPQDRAAGEAVIRQEDR